MKTNTDTVLNQINSMKPQLAILVICAFLAVDSQSDGVGEWSLVTKLNFSSQIRLHPHILFLVTVPWCGESRSLMREVSRLVADKKQEFNSIKLIFMYRNTEKMLADAVGATPNEITILYYHHTLAYKYRGKLRAQNILFSIRSQIGIPFEELPLKSLTNPEELKTFLDSTDRALLVLEFCGWTSKLLAKGRSNVTENGFARQADFLGWTSRRSMVMRINTEKDMENAKMTCDIGNDAHKVPWLADFSSVYNTASFEETDNKTLGFSSTCTSKEHALFDSFFTKFMAVSKDFFLPSERHRYGFVSERSMLSSIGIRESGPWSAVLLFAGCPSCLKIIKNEDDLNNIMQTDNTVILELEGDGRDLEPVLPANRPSIILFVDRLSDSEEIRTKSKKALDDFRELALQIHNSYEVYRKTGDQHEKSFQDQALKSTSEPPRLKLSSAARMIKLKEKLSTVTILNEGKHVTLDKVSPDLEGSSLHEVLAYVLQQKKEGKFSSLAKELGFQLLSDDIDIKIVNRLAPETDAQSHLVFPEAPKEELVSMAVYQDQDQSSDIKNLELKDQDNKEKNKAHVYENLLLSSEPRLGNVEVEENQQIKFPGIKGSFFFSDSNYQALQGLTGESKIPRLVIVDPALEQHYVFPEENALDYYSMTDFLTGFLNGSLFLYKKSEAVTLDYHKVDLIPRVTSKSFSELVIGVNQSDSDAWHKDVVVLFSNKWCGFCQRMELVVGEVYRAMKGYISSSQIGASDDTLEDVNLKLPSTLLLDCTLNDCSLILRSINQTEAYPSLILFPAEKKTALLYDGHVGVADVIMFIAENGLYSQHLIHETGILQSIGKNGENSHDTSSSSAKSPEERFHEVVLANPTLKSSVKHHKLDPHSSISSDRAQVVTGSILIATDKLQNVEPFGKSKVLIVKADPSSGFHGIIINKPIRWDALNELEEGLQILTEAPLSFGGPLMLRGSILVALNRGPNEDKYPQVLPDIYFLNQLVTHDKIAEFKSRNQTISDYWFFVGYSSWGWDQLYDEIDDEAWNISNDSLAHFSWPE